ncbi:XRN 5'-3' exonuclease N-terminus-domain-containing protein [Zopfochytrium polystomum]|nr:XRN 5'-3' exonuclease N-terminus-domain-containing protein [Zopfochytrium polystomum]
MGIPKFFRWISERYPLCSTLIQENRIPEFDNLYLDMNGLIHPCSHPNDDNPHFRITEEQIFLAIFNYIDALFCRIRPKKLFFMAVDGVAPRAKMNQQRARRFRTAQEAEDNRKRAIQRGEELPKEAAFDSNSITPGTPFMARLSANLQYFVSKKISEDSSWANIKIVLSGHDVPGEGEHKIMEYIRKSKSMPDYEPNTRHCLYGLDADLIMLGLLSHEPHFSLLREEVTFGRKKKTSATSNPDSQNFYLMHLSIFREYLDLEFSSLKDVLPFPYELERIIDDFILLSYFVGNDFLPNLPGIHINEGALATFFSIYKATLPTLGGYINAEGRLDLERVETLLKEIANLELDAFAEERVDVKYLEGKRENLSPEPRNGRKGRGKGRHGSYKHVVGEDGMEALEQKAQTQQRKSQLVMSTQNKGHYDRVRNFVMNRTTDSPERLFFGTSLPARERSFITTLSKELGLRLIVAENPDDSDDPDTQRIVLLWDDHEDQDDEESDEARRRIFKRYDAAKVEDEVEIEKKAEEEAKLKVETEFVDSKRYYYKEKMGINFDDKEQLSKFVYHYVEGLQWVLSYYYQGVPSWGWFYPYHYAPKITDLVNLKRFDPITFDLGKPFLPFYQLMGVLPAASGNLIPEPLRDLMTDLNSPILDFYPRSFEVDLNGKKQDWEAIVLIPFIDEARLISAIKPREKQLTKEEVLRNTLGHAFIFTNDPSQSYLYKSPSPNAFPDIQSCTAVVKPWHPPSPARIFTGLLPGSRTGKDLLPGFPSLQSIPHTATLGFHGVNVFNTESHNETMVVTISNIFEGRKVEQVAASLLGQRVYVAWPFLIEAYVTSLADEMMVYTESAGATVSGARRVQTTPQTESGQDQFYNTIERVEGVYSKRWGVITGPVDTVVGVRLLKGLQLSDDGSLKKDFGNDAESFFALQAIVEGDEYEDPRYEEKPPPPLEEEFPIGSQVFFLGPVNYGSLGEITGYSNDNLHVKLLDPMDAETSAKFAFTRDIALSCERFDRYTSSYQVAKMLGISTIVLSKLTSSLLMSSKKADQKINIGLNLKFDGKSKKVLGYTRKTAAGWEYSTKAVSLVQDYKNKFPEVFAGLQRKIKADYCEETDFFSPEVAHQRMADLKEWLKTVGTKDFDRVSLDTRAITKDYVKQIEDSVDLLLKGVVPNKTRVVKNVPRQAVLKPSHAKHRLTTQTFELGERVVCVLDAGVVPLAAFGTVIAIDGRTVDVVFDKKFMSGTSLEGRCSESRGMSVYKETLLNLSNIQPLSGRRQGAPAKAVPNRIPGAPLSSLQQRQYQADPSSIPLAPPPSRPAWGGQPQGRPQIQQQQHKSQQSQQQPSWSHTPVKSTQSHSSTDAPFTGVGRRVSATSDQQQQQQRSHQEEPKPTMIQGRPRTSSTPAPVAPGVASAGPLGAPTDGGGGIQAMTDSIKSMLQIGGSPAPEPKPEDVATQSIKSMLQIGGGGSGSAAAPPSGVKRRPQSFHGESPSGVGIGVVGFEGDRAFQQQQGPDLQAMSQQILATLQHPRGGAASARSAGGAIGRGGGASSFGGGTVGGWGGNGGSAYGNNSARNQYQQQQPQQQQEQHQHQHQQYQPQPQQPQQQQHHVLYRPPQYHNGHPAAQPAHHSFSAHGSSSRPSFNNSSGGAYRPYFQNPNPQYQHSNGGGRGGGWRGGGRGGGGSGGAGRGGRAPTPS